MDRAGIQTTAISIRDAGRLIFRITHAFARLRTRYGARGARGARFKQRVAYLYRILLTLRLLRVIDFHETRGNIKFSSIKRFITIGDMCNVICFFVKKILISIQFGIIF